MGVRYQIYGTGLSGVPLRADVIDPAYGGSASQVTGDAQFVRLAGGDRDFVGAHPLWPRECRVYTRPSSDLSALFNGLGEFDARLHVVNTQTGDTFYTGYILPDLFEDAPYSRRSIVQFRATEGIALLKGQSAKDVSDGDVTTWTTAVASMLTSVADVPVDMAVHWYPYRAGTPIPASACPLAEVEYDPNTYRDDRDADEMGAWHSQYDMLKGLLAAQACVVRQHEGRWLVRQLGAAGADGTLKTWTFDGTGAQTSGPDTRNHSLTLTASPFDKTTPRTFERRRNEAILTYDHVPLSQLVQNGDFEGAGIGWTLDSDGFYTTDIITHNAAGGDTPSSRQDNERVLEVKQDVFNPASRQPRRGAEQDVGRITEPPPGTDLRIAASVYEPPKVVGSSGNTAPIPMGFGRLFVDIEDDAGTTWGLTMLTVEVDSDVLGGDGVVAVDPLPRPVKEGQRLTVRDPGKFDIQATITVSENAPAGATQIRGSISKDLKKDWQVKIPSFTQGGTGDKPGGPGVRIFDLVRRDIYTSLSILAPLVTSNGDALFGDVTLGWGCYLVSEPNNTKILTFYADDTTVALDLNGGTLDESITRAFTSDETGGTEEATVRIGDGPTSGNLSRLRLASGGDTGDWKIGAYGGSEAPSGLSLQELHARERLRLLRTRRQRLRLGLPLRDSLPTGTPIPEVHGHEIVHFDGLDYLVSHVEAEPYRGSATLDVVAYDPSLPTSGITIETILKQTDSARGGGRSSFGGGLGGGGTSIEAIVVDASSGDVTEQLPPPSDGVVAYAIRVDDTANEGALRHEDDQGNAIPLRAPLGLQTSYEMKPHEARMLVGGENVWYVAGGTHDVGGFSTTIFGALTVRDVVLDIHPVPYATFVFDVVVKATAAPSATQTFPIDVGATTIQADLPAGSTSHVTTINERVDAGGEVRVTAPSTVDAAMRTPVLGFRAARVPASSLLP